MPLYGESGQFGALLLGRPTNGIRYRDDEVERIVRLADRISEAMDAVQRKSMYIHQISQLAQAQQAVVPMENQNTIPTVEAVEMALRKLYDYAFLGDSPLGEIRLVRSRLTENSQ